MKILFIAHSFNSGGAEKYLSYLVTHCHAQGHECLLVGPGHGPNFWSTDDLCEQVVRIRFGGAHLYGRTTLASYVKAVAKILLNAWSISRVIHRRQPDVVFSNTSAVIAGGIAAKLCGVPHVWHIHENFDTFQLNFVLPAWLVKRTIAILSDKILFVSKLSMISVFPRGHPKALVIHNGVPIPPASEIQGRPLRAGDSAGKRRIGFFGSGEHRKGLDLLIRAVSLVKIRYPDISLDVWGRVDSEQLQALRDLTQGHDVSQNVHFCGFCEEVPQRIAEYSLVVIPSRAESFSLVALEAMSLAVPVVVTKCGGPEEFVINGVDGWVVPVNDHFGLSEAVVASFMFPQKTLAMAQSARDKVASDFDLRDKLQAILDQIRLVSRKLKDASSIVDSRF
jgi:glycosyltransferase involved in cell wall biosynthesis